MPMGRTLPIRGRQLDLRFRRPRRARLDGRFVRAADVGLQRDTAGSSPLGFQASGFHHRKDCESDRKLSTASCRELNQNGTRTARQKKRRKGHKMAKERNASKLL